MGIDLGSQCRKLGLDLLVPDFQFAVFVAIEIKPIHWKFDQRGHGQKNSKNGEQGGVGMITYKIIVWKNIIDEMLEKPNVQLSEHNNIEHKGDNIKQVFLFFQ